MSERPLISFVLFAYNQEQFIREAVKGAFSQTYSPLEIILSDDCSSDATFEIMQEMAREYDGPHEIRLNRNSENLGLVPHFNKLMEMVRGEVIVLAAGDDISLATRTEKSWKILQENPDLQCLSFSLCLIDEQGLTRHMSLPSATAKLETFTLLDLVSGEEFPCLGCSRTFRRDVVEYFGEFGEKCPSEDSPLRLRGMILGAVGISSDQEVLYRRHDGNLSRPANMLVLVGRALLRQYLVDIRTAMKKGRLSVDFADGLKLRLIRGIRRQRLKSKLALSLQDRRAIARTVCAVLLSDLFSVREKAHLFKRIVFRGLVDNSLVIELRKALSKPRMKPRV